MLRLAAGDYALTLAPERGGAVLAFDWRGEPLMRPVCGPDILDAPQRPLVPFSLGVGEDAPAARRSRVWLGADPLPVLEWLGEWSVVTSTPSAATLLDSRCATEEGAPFVASQTFILDRHGLIVTVSLVNLGADAMPAALGVQALSAGGRRAAVPCNRPLEMRWREHALTLVLEPSDNLAITGLTAPGEDIRCCAQPAMLAPGGIASASLRLRTIAQP
ncbi:hypothetical protein KRR38_03190 [Novosphingobium sp. G106]|uniref:hypothetical protein n=1 Tax=Novosphingobium sp. G106 TaxID=2849500 RepID=UPI001C2DDF46|nr:hypothetical protein [Novosphingobium sp. G106]MBV1686701.1 hypothetical protein [Novosphingobium sp. G106]